VRCPYCRQIMSDASLRCPRCASVREGNRWVRRAARPGPDDAGAARAREPASGPAPAPDRAVLAPGASPAGAPVPRATTGGPGWGCAIAGLATAAVVGLVVLIGAVSVAGRGSGGASPVATWSPGYVATFEAACLATGADASYCRCLRTGLEARVPERDMIRFRRRLAAGSSLAADDQRTFREIESRCGH
jgi:hypothetical protein